MDTSHTMDLTTGSVTKKIFSFAVPIMFSNVLQQLYSIADRVVVGQFAADGKQALAAVGSTGALCMLILGLFLGLGVGANVLCANLLGAKKEKELSECMHTAILLAAITGAVVAVLGIWTTPVLLRWMSTPGEVMEQATVYMRIYFLGVPASLLYNFGAGILRAHGDTKRPMVILTVSGLVNVALNLLLVIVFHRSVDGVATATAISQLVSAVAVLDILLKGKGTTKMYFGKLRLHKKQVVNIIRVGVPCGLGSMVFSLANVIIQSAVNSFDSATISAGKTAAQDVGDMFYQVLAAFCAASVSFAGQCYGAGKYKRIDKLVLSGCMLCWSVVLPLAVLCTIFPRQILSLFNSDPEVVEAGISVLLTYCWGYIIFAPSEVLMGCLRGMKRPGITTILNLLSACLPRLIWVWFFFPMHPTIQMLFLCYPISWIISTAVLGGYYLICRKKLQRTEIVQAVQ